jgi:endoplasmic reticulum-Golgi intermediate compartment protein 3
VVLKVTLVSLCIIISLTLVEFADYRRVGIESSIVVDKSRGQRLVVDIDVTLPRVPCYR